MWDVMVNGCGIPEADPVRTVLFVCEHGASRSRMAAAWFTLAAPPGWRAASAALDPAGAVSPNAVRLLAGTPAEGLLDHTAPVPLTAVPAAALVVAIDCDVAGAAWWELSVAEPCAAMRDELAARAAALARALSPTWTADGDR
jgi:hypothetical protein